MVALEAQALGKPIISTPVDGMKKIIKNDYNGYLSENNVDLYNEIITVIKNKSVDEIKILLKKKKL